MLVCQGASLEVAVPVVELEGGGVDWPTYSGHPRAKVGQRMLASGGKLASPKEMAAP